MNAAALRWRRSRQLPSTDLFFRLSCGHRIARGFRREPIVAHGANCFVHGDAMLLVRSDTPDVMRAALAWPGRLAYVVDDDIPGAAHSPGLPNDYRRRLGAFDSAWHQPLIERADLLLAASDVLARQLDSRGAVLRIDPCWPLPLADQRHFAAQWDKAELRIVHLGTGSHRGGLCAIAPAVTALLDRDSSVSFTYVAAEPVSAALEAHPRAHRLVPQTWPRYRRWLAQARFHVALYPLTADRFDRARSCNKLFEHAIVGAVGIYPENWPFAALAGDGAFLAPANASCWADALANAAARRSDLAELARVAALSLSQRDTGSMQHSLWSDFFDIEF